MDLEKILNETLLLVKETGKFIKEEQKNLSSDKIEVKGIHNFVTYIDKSAEKKLVDGLRNILPEAGFITEEQTATNKGEVFNWIVDPLDGTTNYIHRIFPVAISIALQRNNKTILGIVYELGLDEIFYSIEGQAAYLNGKEIKVSDTEYVNDSLIATGFPYYDYERLKGYIKSFEYFMKNSRGLRRLGSAATDLAYVAAGRFDSFYEYSLSPWDVAAGAFLVQQAGGKVCDFDGGDNYLFGKEIIATNKNTFSEFKQIISNTINR